MQGHLNAIGILVVPLVTAVLCWRFQDREGGQQRTVRAVIWGSACAVVCLLTSLHMCGHGRPVIQWLVPSVCVGATVGVIGPPRVRRIAAVLMALAAFGLSRHYLHLVHTPAYTGNPPWVRKFEATINRSHLDGIRRALQEAARDESAICPTGWLDQSPVSDFFGADLPELPRGRSTVTRPAWHTQLTGLYYTETRGDLRIWCPGGPANEAIAGLEFRPGP